MGISLANFRHRCRSLSLAITAPLVLLACGAAPEDNHESANSRPAASLIATLTCRTGETPMPVYACFVAPPGGSSGSAKIRNGSSVRRLSEIEVLSEFSDHDVQIKLEDDFVLNLQPSSAESFVLAVRITENGKCLFQDESAGSEPISVSTSDL